MYDGTEGQSSKGTKGRPAQDFYTTSSEETFKRFKLFERLEPYLKIVDYRNPETAPLCVS
jgi:hypothetical protein